MTGKSGKFIYQSFIKYRRMKKVAHSEPPGFSDIHHCENSSDSKGGACNMHGLGVGVEFREIKGHIRNGAHGKAI
jgi:hypothetical protein